MKKRTTHYLPPNCLKSASLPFLTLFNNGTIHEDKKLKISCNSWLPTLHIKLPSVFDKVTSNDYFFLFLSQLLLHGRSYLHFSQSIKLSCIWLSYLKFFFHLVQLLKAKMIIFYPGLELFKLAILYILNFFFFFSLQFTQFFCPKSCDSSLLFLFIGFIYFPL